MPNKLFNSFIAFTTCSICSVLYAQDCPSSGKQLSNELWPLKLASISNGAFVSAPSAKKVPALFAAKVMASWHGKTAPELLIYEKDLSSTLNKELFWKDYHAEMERKKIPLIEQERLKASIKFVPNFGSNWQRDHSVYTVQYPDKKITMHNFLEMKNEGEEFQKATSVINKHETVSPKVDHNKNKNGNAGGNVLGIPGGLCLTGNNIDTQAAENFCPEKDRIQIETHWLFTGHVDEIIKFVPDFSDRKSPPECRFKILANSPRKAFEILKLNPHNPFMMSLISGEEQENEKKMTLRTACLIMDSVKFRFNKSSPIKHKGSRARQAWINQFSFISSARAQEVDDGKWIMETDEETAEIMKRCQLHEEELTNRNVVDSILKNRDIVRANEVIEKTISRGLEKIQSALEKRLPHCDLKNKIIPVPQIYTGAEVYKKNGVYELSDPGTSTTIFPNITNSVTSNETIIISHQRNQAFHDYTDKTMKELGLKADYIDTLFFSDLGNGNIHCATSSVHVCE